MASLNHTLPSPDISDVMKLLCAMKKQNDEILTKLNSIEDDNRKLKQELLEIKNSLKLNHNIKVSSKKRDEPEDELEDEIEHPNTNKKARVSVSVASLPPEPELVHILEPPASFNTLDDDCLGNVLDFVGKKCYSVFGRVNKRCNEMFCSKGYPKKTYWYGYAPLRLIQQQRRWNYNKKISIGVLYFNRKDILEWMFTDESYDGHMRLKWLCLEAIEESRLDILREVFQRANECQLEYLRNLEHELGLCATAAEYGKLECMKFLRENECRWDDLTWREAKCEVHEHILQYLRDNGYPTEWQVDSESESEDDSY